MDLKELQKNWDLFGKLDPLAAIFKPEIRGKKWSVEEFFELGRQEIDALMKDIISTGFNLSRRTALDFGCGVGRVTQALARYFENVSGIDIAPSMIELAKQYNRFPEKCTYFLNESADLKLFPDNHFNFVYSNITLQHIEPRYSINYLKEFLRVLVPEGLLVFQLPSERVIQPEDQKWERRLKRSIRPFIPKVLLNSYYSSRGIKPEETPEDHPQMEMYAVPQEVVVRSLEIDGGRVLQVSKNQNSGPHWISLRYSVTKSR